jgi:hypothetical protein
MTDFIAAILGQPVSGIPARHWQAFLRIFAEGVEEDVVERKLTAMRTDAEKAGLTVEGMEAFDRVQDGLRDLLSKS